MSIETIICLLGRTEKGPEDEKALNMRAKKRVMGLDYLGFYEGPIPEDKTEDRVRQLFQIPM